MLTRRDGPLMSLTFAVSNPGESRSETFVATSACDEHERGKLAATGSSTLRWSFEVNVIGCNALACCLVAYRHSLMRYCRQYRSHRTAAPAAIAAHDSDRPSGNVHRATTRL